MISRFQHKNSLVLAALALSILFGATAALGQTTGFTYQGRLTDGGAPANGNYDLQFALWDSLGGGNQIGSQTINSVLVTNGVFTVSLDFGANSFPGANRFLEISARPTGGSFTLLTPRQPITSTPYALRALNASSADSIPASGVPAGSGNYIQNATSPQSASNFNISGNGTAGGTLSGNFVNATAVNATAQYNLNGSRILSNPGSGNLFAGVGAGAANTGTTNSFFGSGAGSSNTTGGSNSFFGSGAGSSNTAGGFNSFFGETAGTSNTTGQGNSFFGLGAGSSNTTGGSNSFFGDIAGGANTTGLGNSFFGIEAGLLNTTGRLNSFFGTNAGRSNGTGEFNTAIGTGAGVGSGNLTNATAIGARAQVDASNALVLGSINGVNSAFVDTNVGIGTTAPKARLHIAANNGHILLGDAGCSQSGDVGIGFSSPLSGCANFALLGGDGSTYINRPAGGTIFFREGNGSNQVTIKPGGLVTIAGLGTGGTATLCRNASLEIASCSSSLRYKTEVKPFGGGLQLIQRLQPVSFLWKANQQPDIGLVAEEVAQVEPRLTFKNKDGEIEGVNYSQVSAVLINAVKEQQVQIQQQRELIERQQALANRQQRQLNALKKLACRSHRRAGVCK